MQAQLKDQKIDKRPKFYTKLANNPGKGRLRRGKALGTNVLQLERQFERVGSFDDVSGNASFTETFIHNMRAFPIPFGFIRVWKESEGEGTVSDIVDILPRGDASQDTVFNMPDITKKDIKVTGFLFLAGGQGYKYRIQLRLFREI